MASVDDIPALNNGNYGVSNYWKFECLFRKLFKMTPIKAPNSTLLALCECELPVTSGFRHKDPSNLEAFSCFDCHDAKSCHEASYVTFIDRQVTSSLFSGVKYDMVNLLKTTSNLFRVWVRPGFKRATTMTDRSSDAVNNERYAHFVAQLSHYRCSP